MVVGKAQEGLRGSWSRDTTVRKQREKVLVLAHQSRTPASGMGPPTLREADFLLGASSSPHIPEGAGRMKRRRDSTDNGQC